jgi:hypothetical protein
MAIIDVRIPEWVQIGKKQVKQQVTIIPRSSYINAGPGPTDTVPAALTPGEQVVPREAVQAAGGPQGVQQAINEKIAPRGIMLGGQPKAVGEDMPPQGQQAGYSTRGICGYSSVTIPGGPVLPTTNEPQKEPSIAIPGGPTMPGNPIIPRTIKMTAPTLSTVSKPATGIFAAPTGISAAPTSTQSAPAVPQIQQQSAPQPTPATPPSTNLTPAQTAPAVRGIVQPNANYAQQQLQNPFYSSIRQDAMEAMQKQRAAQNIVQNQQLAEAGISPTSTIGRVGAAEQGVAAEQAAGQAVQGINTQAMQNIRQDAVNSANAKIAAGDYAGANQDLANIGQPTIDFSKVEDAKRSENLIGMANRLTEIAKNMDPNDPHTKTLLAEAGKYQLQAYKLIGGTDFDMTALNKAFDDISSGNETSPEATALYGHVLPTVLNYFTQDTKGQAALDDIKASPTASKVVTDAMNGDEAAATEFGRIARAQFNLGAGGSEALDPADEAILKKYGLYRTTSDMTTGNKIELTHSDLSGNAHKQTRKGMFNDYYNVPQLDEAYDNKKKVLYNGVEYDVIERIHLQSVGVGGWQHVDYQLRASDGSKIYVTTKDGVTEVHQGFLPIAR